MSTQEPTRQDATTSRDAANWARQVTKLKVGEVPAEAVNRNVEGRRVMGPIQGFGKMWQKTYRMELHGAMYTVDRTHTIRASFQLERTRLRSSYGCVLASYGDTRMVSKVAVRLHRLV